MIIDWTQGAISQNVGYWGLGFILNWSSSTVVIPEVVIEIVEKQVKEFGDLLLSLVGEKQIEGITGKFIEEVG